MMKRLCIIVLLAGLAAAPLAAEDSWVSIGPWGGSVSSLVVNSRNPRILYAGSIGGIFKSMDGGLSWMDIQGDLPSSYVQALAISPSAPDTLYIAVGSGQLSYGVFHSNDGGATWQGWNSGLHDPSCSCYDLETFSLAVHPQNPKIAVAGLGPGLARTTDGGLSWVRHQSPFGLRALTFDPVQPSVLYAGTASGVVKSKDGGVTWTSASSGLGQASVTAIALASGKPGTLYAGTSAGVFKSSDAAGHWKLASAGLTDRGVLALAVSPARGGASATIWAGTAGGAFRSRNGGTSWVRASLGLRNQPIVALATHPTTPRILWAASGEKQLPMPTPGLFRSINGGDRWRVSNQGLSAQYVTSIAVDPRFPGDLWAGIARGGVWHSTDGGATWAERSRGTNEFNVIRDLVIDPENPEVLWAATERGLFRGTDGGAIWHLLSEEVTDPRNGQPLPTSLIRLSGDPRILWLGTDRGLFRSVDEGETWLQVSSTELEAVTIRDLLLDPRDPDNLIVNTAWSLAWSTDGGLSWTSPDLGRLLSIYSLARDPEDPERIVAGGLTSWMGVSHDNGRSWTAIPAPSEDTVFYSLVIDPVDGSIWAGGSGIYNLSEDGTLQMPPLTSTVQALDLELDPHNPNVLYAAAPHKGILKHMRE